MHKVMVCVFVLLTGCASTPSVHDVGSCDEEVKGDHGERAIWCHGVKGEARWAAHVTCPDVAAVVALDLGPTAGSVSYTLTSGGDALRDGTVVQGGLDSHPSASVAVQDANATVTLLILTSSDFDGHFRASIWCQ